MAKTIHKISGMTCAGCVRAVERALGAAAPGTVIEVDRAQGLVSIEPGADAAIVKKAIEAAGFVYEGTA